MPFLAGELTPLEARLGAWLAESMADVTVVAEWVHGSHRAEPSGTSDDEPTEQASGPVAPAAAPQEGTAMEPDEAGSAAAEPAIQDVADPLAVARSLDRLSAEALAHIEELEAAKARLEGQLVEAYGALHTIVGEQFGVRASGYNKTVPVSADQIAVKEVAAATGVGEAEVWRRMRLATGVRRHRVVREALKAGRVGLYRALQLVAECRDVADDAQPALEHAALEPARDGGVRSQRSFTGRLRRLVKSADTRGEAERRAAARRSRTAYGRVGDDGMGSLTLVADAERIAAILARADAVARTARSQGDPRTLEQLRADFISDTLLFGWPHPTDCSPAAPEASASPGSSEASASPGSSEASAFAGSSQAPASPDEPGRPSECDQCGDFDPGAIPRRPFASGPASETASEWASAGRRGSHRHHQEADSDADPPGFQPGLWLGRPPPANVWIIVPFEVAAGLSDAPCELPGHGWVTAEHARQVITAPGSVWHQLSVELDTGKALHLESRGYQPSRELVAQVRARDGICRGPGCDVPATRCDLDHEIAWPDGATSYINLYAKHRFCHMSKTAKVWKSEPSSGDALKWTTLTGRDYLTYPKDWLESLREHDELRQTVGQHAGEEGAAEGEAAENVGAEEGLALSEGGAEEGLAVSEDGVESTPGADAGSRSAPADLPPF